MATTSKRTTTPSAGSTGHGVWIGSGNTYLNTFQVFTFDEQGKYDGKRVIHASITMDGNDHYTGQVCDGPYRCGGNVTKNIFSGGFEGTRMEPELPEFK